MKKFTKILAVALTSAALVGCDDILARPQVVDTPIVTIDGKDYYCNNFKVIYDQLVSSGTSNGTIINALTKMMAGMEVKDVYGLTSVTLDEIFDNALVELNNSSTKGSKKAYGEDATIALSIENYIVDSVKEKMMAKVSGGTYDVDYKFDENKLIHELETSLYVVEGKSSPKIDYTITPDSKYEDVFTCDYSDYYKKSMFDEFYKELLTSSYLFKFNGTSLGRAYARKASYIKLPTITEHLDSTSQLINKYFEECFDNKSMSFSLESLARIYKGASSCEPGSPEAKFVADYGSASNRLFWTKEALIDEEIEKFASYDSATGKYEIKELNDDRDDTLLSSYTGNYSYPISRGRELKVESVKQESYVTGKSADKSEANLALKSGGLSSLPASLRDRLFSSSVNNYLSTEEKFGYTRFVTPKSTLSSSKAPVDKYAFYDTASTSYYICVFEDSYNTADLSDRETNVDVKALSLSIARLLGESAGNQKTALMYYLDKYDLEFGDQDFYDYIESTYPDILDDNYSK